ncbi:Transcriptional coactivator [Olea europaea subsp. europaea]|uniref:Transcriptional coactivator n=1 Tax=Olea europaea subsp. europaea TaxID=158383 RepID=A0A8S0R925_OLEEU|nr:Transcriptional coactivator [Olea europaea subsp. europaea]
MVIMNLGARMSGDRHCPRIDIYGLKVRIERKLGGQKAGKYFDLLNRYLSLKLSKSEFNKLCIGLLGREDIVLHNGLIQAIIKNACVANIPPPKYGKSEASLNVIWPNAYQRSSLQSFCRDVFPRSLRKGRTDTLRHRKFRDRLNPLRPHGKAHNVATENSVPKVQEQQSSKSPVEITSVEDVEDVEQAAGSPGIYRRSPVKAPLGVSLNAMRKMLCHGSAPFVYMDTCFNNGELPDTSSLKKRLERKLDMEGLKLSTSCVHLLNNGLNIFMKRLVEPCLHLAASRSECTLHNQVYHQTKSIVNGIRPMSYIENSERLFFVSMLDFQVAMESNPRIIGADWPVLLEEVSLHASKVHTAE